MNDKNTCYFHPREVVVGICALCLNEKLLILAAKQGLIHQTHKSLCVKTKKTPIVLTKIFALTSLRNRLEIKHKQTPDCHSSSTSPEDSFISIKFEENGVSSWEKGKTSKMSYDQQCEMPWNDKEKKIKSVVEHAKPRSTLRWRKRIGHIFQLIRWKRSNKGNVCHVGTKPRRTKGL
ncbi:hypothetical protein ACS0TY_036024 [Phlomoides rotata]